MAVLNSPGRNLDGPNANFAGIVESCQITLANNATLLLGQPVCILTTALGPQTTVSNAKSLPLANQQPTCEVVVPSTATGAGAVFGVFNGNYRAKNSGAIYSASGINNTSGAAVTYIIEVVQEGFAYVLAGSAAAGAAVNVGSTLITTTAQPFAIAGAASIFGTIGQALGTYNGGVNPTTIAAATASGAQTVIPSNMAGITTTNQVLVDTIQSGVQETVTPSAIGANADRFTATFANAHAANTPIAVVQTAAGGTLFSVPTAGTVSGLIAAMVAIR